MLVAASFAADAMLFAFDADGLLLLMPLFCHLPFLPRQLPPMLKIRRLCFSLATPPPDAFDILPPLLPLFSSAAAMLLVSLHAAAATPFTPCVSVMLAAI